ncbi:autotransporter family protein [Tardiphaga alba]|uniref:autotransporter family protein n=1 Tax=Tardiphaga alba TaxID=340268 RepID=UPI0020127135|nr:autotransporter outer membrane beta-barrel domain-containing protein [Tardiphaga alba]
MANGSVVTATDFYVGGDSGGSRGGTGTVNIGAASGSAPVAAGLINTGTLQFVNAGNLVFNHTSQNYTFAPLITGDATVTVEAGTTILAAANTYTGDTNINGGTLLVNGATDANGLVLVNPGGTLGGTGSVGAVFLADHATLAPGTPSTIGTLTINGVLMMCDCSSYIVKADNLGNADKVLVNGIANLDGLLKVAPTTWIGSATNSLILSATAGVGGDFTSATSLHPWLGRVAGWNIIGDDVFLTLDRGSLAAALPANAPANAKAIGTGIENAVIGGATPNSQIIGLMRLSGSNLAQALNQLSGEIGAAQQQMGYSAANYFMNAMFDPFAMGRDGRADNGAMAFAGEADAMAYAPRGSRDARDAYAAMATKAPRDNRFDRWSAWGMAYGGNTSISGSTTTGSSDTISRVYGVAAGADYLLSRDTVLGIALGGGGSSFAVANGLGSGRAEMFQSGIYGKHIMGAAYFKAGLSYTYQDVTTDRTVTVAGTDRLQASFGSHIVGGRVEGGYRFMRHDLGVTPYAGFQVTHINLPSYGESALSGAGGFALNHSASATTISRSELGARFDRAFVMDRSVLTLRSRVAWAHDEGNDGAVSASFASLPGASFTVNGAVTSKDLALFSAGADMKWNNGFSLAGSFDGEFSDTSRGYGGRAVLRYTW